LNNRQASSSRNLKDKTPKEFSLLERARRLVLTHGWNSTAYQIINPGIRHWFSKGGDGVVGFVSRRGVRVVVGAPICAGERLSEVAAEFERDSTHKGDKVCYFCAETRLESLYADSAKHAKVLLGAQPVWQPKDWANIVAKHKSLRAQLNRARNKGVTVTEWSTEKACNNPALLECLREWLAAKGLPPLHFMVETDTLNRLFDRRIFVAELNVTAIGFVLLSPVPQRDGWLFEQYVYQPGSPNGTVELMVDAAMRALAAGDCNYATLGLAPLSTRAQIEPFRNPFWLRILLAWMRVHGRRFYNFDGLDAFKAKLKPERWEPVFAISNEVHLSLTTLYAIAAAFSENAPVRLILSGLWRALKAEIRWFKQGVYKKLGKLRRTEN
jgi:phosphatidylglycerol lysyltransferase